MYFECVSGVASKYSRHVVSKYPQDTFEVTPMLPRDILEVAAEKRTFTPKLIRLTLGVTSSYVEATPRLECVSKLRLTFDDVLHSCR